MNKSSIITVLGTAALGLIKSKMGSGIRLEKRYYTFFQETYDVKIEDAPNVIRLIHSLEPLINEKGFLLEGIKSYENTDRDGKEHIRISVNIQKLLTSPQDVQNCNDWLDHVVEGFWENWEMSEGSQELHLFIGRSITFILEKNYLIYDIGDDFDFGYRTSIVNADTGEEYEPKMKVSKLRKR